MEKKEYLNEEKYQESNRKIKKVGKIIIIIGLCMMIFGAILIVIGLINAGTEFTSGLQDSSSINPIGFIGGIGGAFIGFSISGTGTIVTVIGLVVRFLIGNRREIAAYTAQQSMPVAKEEIEKMSPSVGKAAKDVAKGVTEGIEEAKKGKK